MKILKYSFLINLFVFVLIFTSCTDENALHSKKNFEKLYWLEGNWKGELNDGIYFESWKKVSPDLLSGSSYLLEGKDTILSEKSNIIRGYKNVLYSVKVGDEKEVDFELMELTDALAIFENLYHDFPQRIIYIKKDNDNLLVKIEGEVKNETASHEFRLKRQK